MKLSHTNRARVLLAVSPILVPLLLLEAALRGLIASLGQFWWHADFQGALLDWYRYVWRVAVYGSVHDRQRAVRAREPR